MSSTCIAPSLESLLAASAALPDFKTDVLAYAAYRPATRVVVSSIAPRVKVLRTISQLLDAHPSLVIAHVRVKGMSGCSDFRGELAARTDAGVEHTWDFAWDCRWRARESGLLDGGGYPDQTRAVREFGWRCFSLWRARD